MFHPDTECSTNHSSVKSSVAIDKKEALVSPVSQAELESQSRLSSPKCYFEELLEMKDK